MHGHRIRVVILFDHPLGVLEYLLVRLHHGIGRKSAVFLGEAHAATCGREPHSQPVGSLELDARKVALGALSGEKIVMVRRAGATCLQELAHRKKRGVIDGLVVDIFPDFIKIYQPVEQLCVLHCRKISRQCLEEMVVRVHEARNHNQIRAVDYPVIFGNSQSHSDSVDLSAVYAHVHARKSRSVGACHQRVDILEENTLLVHAFSPLGTGCPVTW